MAKSATSAIAPESNPSRTQVLPITLTTPTLKGIDSAIKKLALVSGSIKSKAFAIADSIIILGDSTNSGYQSFNRLFVAIDSNKQLQKELQAYIAGRIPHGIRNKDGQLIIGKLDKSLLVDKETLAKMAATKKETSKKTQEKTAQKRADDKAKLVEHAQLVEQIKTLQATKGEVSKVELNKIKTLNESLKTTAKDAVKSAKLSSDKEQRAKTALDVAIMELTKTKTAFDSLQSEHAVLQAAYSKLVIENQQLTGALNHIKKVA
jgi:hypothetical protein